MNSYRLVKPYSFLLSIIRYNHRTVPYPDITHPEQTIRIPGTNEEKLALPLERPRFIDEYSLTGPPTGRIYEKIPFKYRVEKGRAYLYCSCGWANTQPFCDGMCKHKQKMFGGVIPIVISSTSMQRAEQIMSQSTNKPDYDQFNDDVDDDELCRACDELENVSQQLQSQQNDSNNIESTDNLSPNSLGSLKRKRHGVSTTPNERRAIIRKH
ncbi:unnamed protein product [Rotaria magnacalcarata]